MLRKCSLETFMKWIFMVLALTMVALTLGTRLYQSYNERVRQTRASGAAQKVAIEGRKYAMERDIIIGSMGACWREAQRNEKPELVVKSGADEVRLVLNQPAIVASIAEDERYLLLVGLLGLVIAVELTVFISYILSRPLRQLAWGCREIAKGTRIRIPQNYISPYEFQALTDSFNEMAEQLDKWKDVQRQLYRMDRLAALGEMMSGLSHEIRNPLASMRIQIDLLHSELESIEESCGESQDVSDANEQIQLLEGEIDRLNGIVSQLLAFVRPRQLAISPVCLEDILPWVVSMFNQQTSKAGIEFSVMARQKNIVVMADTEMVRQILLNLVLNAIQAMSHEQSGRRRVLSVTVSCESDERGEFGLLSVSDSGPGIPGEIQYRIFDPFFTTRKEGTGLGLSIVQRIVDGMAGYLSFETSSSGTTFTVRLPICGSGSKNDENGEALC